MAVRPCELRYAKWGEIDFDEKEWRYHVTKTNVDHIVPLSRQAIEILNDLKKFTYRGPDSFIFPSINRSNGRPISDGTINSVISILGFGKEQKHHGLRATFETEFRELGYPGDWIDKQLAHKSKIKFKGAYNRAEYREQRHLMMQRWADYLDEIKKIGANFSLLREKYRFRF